MMQVRIEIRSLLIKMDPKSNESVFRRDKKGHAETPREKGQEKMRLSLERSGRKPRDSRLASIYHRLGERYGWVFPPSPRRINIANTLILDF